MDWVKINENPIAASLFTILSITGGMHNFSL